MKIVCDCCPSASAPSPPPSTWTLMLSGSPLKLGRDTFLTRLELLRLSALLISDGGWAWRRTRGALEGHRGKDLENTRGHLKDARDTKKQLRCSLVSLDRDCESEEDGCRRLTLYVTLWEHHSAGRRVRRTLLGGVLRTDVTGVVQYLVLDLPVNVPVVRFRENCSLGRIRVKCRT